MRGILLDIEGTTTPISFVYGVLFPYARLHARDHLRNEDLTELKREFEADIRKGANPPAWSGEPVAYVHWLMDQDRKSTTLKNLQGKIWLEGYRSGELRGEVFEDVPEALKEWHEQGADVRIFSSGSVLAQRLLFSSTRHGDLTVYLNGFFDTTVGAKNEPRSYRRIAAAFGCPSDEIAFVSDVVRELDAAQQCGMQTRLCLRPGNPPQPPHNHTAITELRRSLQQE